MIGASVIVFSHSEQFSWFFICSKCEPGTPCFIFQKRLLSFFKTTKGVIWRFLFLFYGSNIILSYLVFSLVKAVLPIVLL